MTDVPLIYTSRGNLPVADLIYSAAWEDTAASTVFIETYRLGDEVVKRSVHALSKTGLASVSAAGGTN